MQQLWNILGLGLCAVFALAVTSTAAATPDETSGTYECTAGGEPEEFTVYASPNVKQYERTKNVKVDNTLQVDCVAWGTLPLTVTWTFDETSVDANDDRITYENSFSSGKQLTNATLRIQNFKYEDAGDFVCVARNEYGSAKASVTVHVVDTVAAVWPFLGLCAEVAILCTIVFIYEKCSKKRQEEAAAREEKADRLNTVVTKPSADARQRK